MARPRRKPGRPDRQLAAGWPEKKPSTTATYVGARLAGIIPGRADPDRVLAAGIAALGVVVDPGFQARTHTYLRELARWSRVTHLTGYRDATDQVVHLILESVMMLAIDPGLGSPLLDVGSGAGAPGLVLQLARPHWSVTLIEANRRRANFLRHMVRELQLSQAAIEEGRAESLAAAPHLMGAFQSITLRAVASAGVSLNLARPFLAPGGCVVVALGPGRTGPGTIREVTLTDAAAGLRLHRRFLIMHASAQPVGVPRGTRGGRGPGPGGGQPEGRRR